MHFLNHFKKFLLICGFSIFHLDAPSNTKLITVPYNTTLLRGSNMSLQCGTDANPEDVNFLIYLNGKLIGNSSSGVFNTTVKEDGVYTCVPVNTVGKGDNATVSTTAVGNLVLHFYFLCMIMTLFSHYLTVKNMLHDAISSHN